MRNLLACDHCWPLLSMERVQAGEVPGEVVAGAYVLDTDSSQGGCLPAPQLVALTFEGTWNVSDTKKTALYFA